MTQIRQQSQGMCRNCGYVGAKASMTRHQAKCPERGVVGESGAQAATSQTVASQKTGKQTSSHEVYRLRVSGQYNPEYWLDLEVPVGATLDHLDGFLRGIWLECCGHMSAFTVGPQDDYDNFGPFSAPKARSQPPLSKLGLDVGQKFGYTYDFGSSTDLSVTVQAREQVIGKASKSVRLLARNMAPELLCSECEASAKWVHSWDYDEATGGPLLYCAKHGKKTREEQLPVVNSPRMGVCGYDGGNLDDWPPAPQSGGAQEAAKPGKTAPPKKASPTKAGSVEPSGMREAWTELAVLRGLTGRLAEEPDDAGLDDDFDADDLEAMIAEALKVPLEGEVDWLVATQPLPELADEEGLPVVVLILNLGTGLILRSEVVLDPKAQDILDVTLLEMIEPFGGPGSDGPGSDGLRITEPDDDTPGYRPGRIFTEDAALAFSLHAGLARLGVQVERREFPELSPLLADLRAEITQGLPEHLESQQRRAYLSSAPDEQVRELLVAFGRFLKAAPWNLLTSGKPLYAHWTDEDGQPCQLYATLMGEMGEVFGLALYPDWISHAKHLINSQQGFFFDPQFMLRATGGVESLQQSEPDELHPDDLARLRSAGLPVRATAAPELLRFGPDGTLPPISPLRGVIAMLNVVAARAEQKPGRAVTSLRGEHGGVAVQYPAGPREELGEQELQGSVRLSVRGTSPGLSSSGLYGGEVVIIGPPGALLKRVFSAARAEIKAQLDTRRRQRKADIKQVYFPAQLDIRDAVLEDEHLPGLLGGPLRVKIWDSHAQAPDLTLAHLLRLGPLTDALSMTNLYANPLPEQAGAVSVELPELD